MCYRYVLGHQPRGVLLGLANWESLTGNILLSTSHRM